MRYVGVKGNVTSKRTSLKKQWAMQFALWLGAYGRDKFHQLYNTIARAY
jgi:hypothetical protein